MSVKEAKDWPFNSYRTSTYKITMDPSMAAYNNFNSISYMFGAPLSDVGDQYTNLNSIEGLQYLNIANATDAQYTFAYAGMENTLFGGISGIQD